MPDDRNHANYPYQREPEMTVEDVLKRRVDEVREILTNYDQIGSDVEAIGFDFDRSIHELRRWLKEYDRQNKGIRKLRLANTTLARLTAPEFTTPDEGE